MTKAKTKESAPDYSTLDFPPTPWSWDIGNWYNSQTYIFCGSKPKKGMDFLEINNDCDFMSIDDQELATFIVRACNAHDALVSALEEMTEHYCMLTGSGDYCHNDPEQDGKVQRSRAALALAKGE